MGVDVEMAVTTKEKVTEEQVLAWSTKLVEAFGLGMFWLDRKYKRHALCISEVWRRLLPSKQEDETFIYVDLLTRYYGKGYERGPLPQILTMACWLQDTIPSSSIWYGGDCGPTLEPFGDLEQQELWNHFVAVGHNPYRKDSAEDQPFSGIPHCKFCGNYRMIRFGFGGAYAAYSCHGCGFEILTNDAGKVWRVSREVGGRETVGPNKRRPLHVSDDCPILDPSFVEWK